MQKNVLIILLILILPTLISAINLEVKANPISKTVITEFENSATFELTIKNLEGIDNINNSFETYSLVGVDIIPKIFELESNKESKILFEFSPQKPYDSKKGFFTFEYKIKNQNQENQGNILTINIVDLKEALTITATDINPDSIKTIIKVKNSVDYNFKELNLVLDSVFFEYEKSISLGPLESKEFEVPLNIEKLSKSIASSYLLNIDIETNNILKKFESKINFIEKSGVSTLENQEGTFIKKHEIIKTNSGNVVKQIEITMQKGVISHLFTTFNTAPGKTTREGSLYLYSWTKEIQPGEDMKITATTNWFFPVIVFFLIIGLYYLIKRHVESDLILNKKVSFVKTKGGEFALKINLHIIAKNEIDNVKIVDRLPHLVKLYEKFGINVPDKIDLKTRQIEWNINNLKAGESKIYSYIIYSKIGVVGRFELPISRAYYNKLGKAKHVDSNRSFYINESNL